MGATRTRPRLAVRTRGRRPAGWRQSDMQAGRDSELYSAPARGQRRLGRLRSGGTCDATPASPTQRVFGGHSHIRAGCALHVSLDTTQRGHLLGRQRELEEVCVVRLVCRALGQHRENVPRLDDPPARSATQSTEILHLYPAARSSATRGWRGRRVPQGTCRLKRAGRGAVMGVLTAKAL